MAPLHLIPHTRAPVLRFAGALAASKFVAREIDKLVRSRTAAGRNTVLGLATGSTPVGLYRELIRLHKDEGLDLSRVVTFNLDEYYPMPREDAHSYFRWMHETFFNHVNIPWNNIHIPDGTLAVEDVDEFCAEYERKVKAAGGIDVQVLGTRRIFLMAFGEHKAAVVYKAVEQPPTEAVSASFLQEHPDATVVLDEAAAAELTAIKRPWEVGPCEWTPELVRKAVVNLALTARKGLQKLNDD